MWIEGNHNSVVDAISWLQQAPLELVEMIEILSTYIDNILTNLFSQQKFSIKHFEMKSILHVYAKNFY